MSTRTPCSSGERDAAARPGTAFAADTATSAAASAATSPRAILETAAIPGRDRPFDHGARWAERRIFRPAGSYCSGACRRRHGEPPAVVPPVDEQHLDR